MEIEHFVLQAAILHECQNYLGDGGGLALLPLELQPPHFRPVGTFENQDCRH